VDEDIYAAYGQGSVELGRWTVLGGVRFERTEVETEAVRILGGAITPATDSGAYDNWLPSLHLRYDVTDSIVLRAAYTNTIGRPDFSQITAREQIGLTGARPTLSRGNPDLQPRDSEGLDLSFEWYLPDGLIALAVFRKDIQNEIFTLTTTEELDLGVGRGVETVDVSEPRNAQSAEVLGFEASYQQAFTMLPASFDGLGFNGNITVLDTELTFLTAAGPRKLTFFQQPDLVTNASVYYQRGPFEGRVSTNYIGGFLETVNGTIPGADQYWKGRHTWDAQVSWRFTDAITAFAEVENLNDSGRLEVTGPNRDLLQESAEYGRVYWLGVTASF
jgi:TonB-dependent receptor